jgi:hypothetical protein
MTNRERSQTNQETDLLYIWYLVNIISIWLQVYHKLRGLHIKKSGSKCTPNCTTYVFHTRPWLVPKIPKFLWLRIHITLMRIRIPIFTSMRIRILLLCKVKQICNHLSTEPTGFYSEPLRLHCERPRSSTAQFEPLKFLNFDTNADLDSNPDPSLHSNADPDPAF